MLEATDDWIRMKGGLVISDGEAETCPSYEVTKSIDGHRIDILF